MFELYEQGLGTHAIAKKTGRSTHTVHSVLTIRGTRSLPERNTEPAQEESAGRTGGVGGRRRRGKVEGVGTTDRMGDMSGTLMDKLEPKILEACAQFIRSDPETLRQVVGSIMGVKIPRKTPDDMVMETIGEEPTLRREWAETRLQQIKRNGRSEMDIFEEGLDKYFKLARLLNQNAWPQVVNNAVVSGEARQTLVGLVELLKGRATTAEENQNGPPEDAVPSALQQDQESSQVDKSVRENGELEQPDVGGTE
jgi:hypothetical protein